MTRTVVGHFARANEAQAAVDALEQSGFLSEDVTYAAHDGSGPLAEQLGDATEKGGSLVTVRVNEDNIERARQILRARSSSEPGVLDAAVNEGGGSDPANYGGEGGSSQWGQTVLRGDKEGDDAVAERTASRDKKPKKMD